MLADGGNVALTARSDRFTTNKWAGRLGSRDLDRLLVTDFDMIEAGERYAATYDCAREPPPVAAPSPAPVTVPLSPLAHVSLGLLLGALACSRALMRR